jgi:uncharacterized RDD family membrane protein YckC
MAQITILNQSNVPQGPFTRQEVAQKLAVGEFTLDSLAHAEGFAQWTPLRDVLARVDAALVPPVPPVADPAKSPPYSYAATMEPPGHLIYAGFWLRFAAYVIDGLILSVVLGVGIFVLSCGIGIVAGFTGGVASGMNTFSGANGTLGHQLNAIGNNGNPLVAVMVLLVQLLAEVVLVVLTWLYFAKLESGPLQATYGKRAMGIRVTDMLGQRITFGRATGRFFGKIVSTMTIYIGFIMAGFTDRKQALHDMMAGTLVVRS